MINKKTNELILNYIKQNYKLESPIFLKDLYNAFPNTSEGTIRSLMKRYSESGDLEKISSGVYGLPNKGSVLGKTNVGISDIIENKYIRDGMGNIVGYNCGINFSNLLGLTTQTASVNTICSNNVSNKKRITKLKNNRVIINAPRVEVTNENYKLLQVLDLLNDFEKYSEVGLKNAADKIVKYLENVNLSEEEVDDVLSNYPLEAQVGFYKIGGVNAITQKQK